MLTKATFLVIPMIFPPNLDVTDEELRLNNERHFLQELNFAFHLSLHGVVSINLGNSSPEALGELVKKVLPPLFPGVLVIEIPMTDPKANTKVYRSDIPEDEDPEDNDDPWQIWQRFHKKINYDFRVQLALVMTSDLPSDEEIKRWLGEQIYALVVPYTCFMSNKSNYPVLGRKHTSGEKWNDFAFLPLLKFYGFSSVHLHDSHEVWSCH